MSFPQGTNSIAQKLSKVQPGGGGANNQLQGEIEIRNINYQKQQCAREKLDGVDTPLWIWSNPSWRGCPQQRSCLPWCVLVTLLTRLLLTSLRCTRSLVHFIYLYLPLHTIWRALIYPCTWHLQVNCAHPHYISIDLQRFTPEPQTLLSISPNQ